MSATIADKLAGAPTRYTAPICREFVDDKAVEHQQPLPNCSHATGFHEPSGADHNETPRYFGLTWRGAELVFDRPRPMTPSTKPATIAARTTENIAACATLGLSYWAEHPQPHTMGALMLLMEPKDADHRPEFMTTREAENELRRGAALVGQAEEVKAVADVTCRCPPTTMMWSRANRSW